MHCFDKSPLFRITTVWLLTFFLSLYHTMQLYMYSVAWIILETTWNYSCVYKSGIAFNTRCICLFHRSKKKAHKYVKSLYYYEIYDRAINRATWQLIIIYRVCTCELRCIWLQNITLCCVFFIRYHMCVCLLYTSTTCAL